MTKAETTTANGPRFSLGRIVATAGVADHINQHGINPLEFLRRHVSGDWGDVPPEDAQENEFAVSRHLRLMSSYLMAGERVWIITEADRSVTTLLFPSEY